jgi:hypothetical protein
VRSASIKRNEDRARTARRALRTQPGVSRVETNPLTGSITIRYEVGKTSQAALMQFLAKNGYLTPGAPAASPDALEKLLTALAEKAVEKSLLALVAAVL